MLALAMTALHLVSEALAENDGELAKKVIGRALRILGGDDSDERKQEKLAAMLEYMARERASAATSAIMARSEKNG
jgi:hypothetical protein